MMENVFMCGSKLQSRRINKSGQGYLSSYRGCDILFVLQTERTKQSAGCRIELLETRRLGMEILYSSDSSRSAS